jgi:hypothetical protein
MVWLCRSGEWSGQSVQASERRGEVACPGPPFGDVQVNAAGGADEAGGDVQESVTQLLRLGQGVFAVEEQGSGAALRYRDRRTAWTAAPACGQIAWASSMNAAATRRLGGASSPSS